MDQGTHSVNDYVTMIEETYIYRGTAYELIYEFNERTEERICKTPEVEAGLHELYEALPIDLYTYVFSHDMSKYYIFDTEESLNKFRSNEAVKIKADYYKENPPSLNNIRSGSNCWITFYKDCGNTNITICAEDHIDNNEVKVGPAPYFAVCSEKWEQSDLGNVSMPSPPGGDWDQAISRWFVDPGYNEHSISLHSTNASLELALFRGINFDTGSHRCRNFVINISHSQGSVCLTNVRWGFGCADMNDSISSWRAVYCTDISCDSGCFDLFD